jgi:hypothetical protein
MKKIRVWLNATNTKELEKMAQALPVWHCGRGFLEESVRAWDNIKSGYEVYGEPEPAQKPSAVARVLYVSEQQEAFLFSSDADSIFVADTAREFLEQVRQYGLPNAKPVK